MKHRCLTCGTTLSEGIVPLAALSDQGYEIVTGKTRVASEAQRTLGQTIYSGLSEHSFCETCLTIILGAPAGFTVAAESAHELLQPHGVVEGKVSRSVVCSCGEIFAEANADDPYLFKLDWTAINQSRLTHLAAQIAA